MQIAGVIWNLYTDELKARYTEIVSEKHLKFAYCSLSNSKDHLVNHSTMSFASLVSCILFYDATTYTPADFHHLYELKGHTYKIGNLTNAV
ncbi:hypothetical protein F8M41_005140 [Gigaspora margarita]|uniref:Uncharacterized protein n=1 Tax=Gigaspora margarita TaxID=4874 RepID=A0A8H3X8K9_GIGMA|nr:hypothetical protein F8M41_005140 [Gigaspora margarita]